MAVPRQAVGRPDGAHRGPLMRGGRSLWYTFVGFWPRGSRHPEKCLGLRLASRWASPDVGCVLSPLPLGLLVAVDLVPWEVGRAGQTWGPFTRAGQAPAFRWESRSFGAIPTVCLTHSRDTSSFWVTGLLATLRRGVISLQKDAYVHEHTKI